jgi:3-hydroxyacyl-CoA dehydrogenase
VAEIRTIAVIGAGIMGRGIAHAAALGGYRTILEDLLPNAFLEIFTVTRYEDTRSNTSVSVASVTIGKVPNPVPLLQLWKRMTTLSRRKSAGGWPKKLS